MIKKNTAKNSFYKIGKKLTKLNKRKRAVRLGVKGGEEAFVTVQRTAAY